MVERDPHAATTVSRPAYGMAGRPATHEFAVGVDLRDAINALAWELEGYEDMHASSRMRRDILRRVGPVVIEEALQCAE